MDNTQLKEEINYLYRLAIKTHKSGAVVNFGASDASLALCLAEAVKTWNGRVIVLDSRQRSNGDPQDASHDDDPFLPPRLKTPWVNHSKTPFPDRCSPLPVEPESLSSLAAQANGKRAGAADGRAGAELSDFAAQDACGQPAQGDCLLSAGTGPHLLGSRQTAGVV